MALQLTKGGTNRETLYELQRISRLLGLLAIRETETMGEKVALLAQMGFSPTEIATMLNTTPQTVSVRLREMRQASHGKAKRKVRTNTLKF